VDALLEVEPELVAVELEELVGVCDELEEPPPTAPITCTDSPTWLVSTLGFAPCGSTSLYVVPAVSVRVKFGEAPPRQPSVIAPSAPELLLEGALAEEVDVLGEVA
jgi:hypothetical protein